MSTPWKTLFRLAACLCLAGAFLACSANRPSRAGSPGERPARHADYQQASASARAWLDALEFDPVALRRVGIAGKKVYGEILGAYSLLLRHASDEDRAALQPRVAELVAHSRRPEYHDLATCGDRQFVEDSMSYLRVLWLLSDLGEDVEEYREQVVAIQPRLDAHLSQRGPWQRATFVDYYDRLGLEKPPILQNARMQGGVVARRLVVEDYDPPDRRGNQDTYDLTHEIFVAYAFGTRTWQDAFDTADLEYIREALPPLVSRYVFEDDPDLVAELLLCMTMIGQREDPALVKGIDFLLDGQNKTGSWGNYEDLRPMWRQFLEHRIYLHTTYVVLWALQEHFEAQ